MSAVNRLAVERHGIEFVPLTERYGTPPRLFFVWFGGCLTILCLSVGTLGITAGLPLAWTVAALALGNAVGTTFMAAHSAQGPQLGIPQMIQSRAQFGVIGAGLPLLAVLASTILYIASIGLLARETLEALLPVSDNQALVVFAAATIAIAYVGYELIHRMAAALTVLSGALYLVVAVTLVLKQATVATTAHTAHFSPGAFLLIVSLATSWSLSAGPYVADYSRYLPPTVSESSTFWYTALGNFLGSTSLQALGAYLAAHFPAMTDHPARGIAGLFGSGSHLVEILFVCNLIQVNVMTLYSGYMSATTAITGLRGMTRVSLSFKLTLMLALMVLATVIGLLTRDSFSVYFSDFLALMLCALIPWSAINLTDYYCVRKGRYVIDEMFIADGIYSRFRWPALIVYLLSILLQIPFISLSFYTGPIAKFVGADIAWLPGLIVPAALYAWVESRQALSREAAA
jgi:NCS1 family nucleobase:cation symporter-1